MNPEKIQDALFYLDDDLIEETDALRQGKRVRPTARRIICWVAPAACLALVLGLAPRLLPATETGDSAQVAEGTNLSQGQYLQDDANYGVDVSRQESVRGWQSVSCGGISLSLPAEWTYTLDVEEERLFIVFTPPGEEGGIRVGYQSDFGVCGTGLTEEETTIAGMRARVGTYDGSHVWSYIVFDELEPWYVVLNEGGSQWWGDHGETVMEILETLVIEEKE